MENAETQHPNPNPEPPRPSRPAPPPPSTTTYPQKTGYPQKTPGLAAFLSCVPGLGNIYNGLYARGVAFFLIFVSIFALAVGHERESELAFLLPCLMFFWFFNAFDAYRQATLINHGYATDLGLSDAPQRVGGGGLALGLALVLIGFYGALREYFDVDLSAIIQHWPLGVMAFGGWLLWQWMKTRRDDAQELTEEV